MKLTIAWLDKRGACKDGVEWFRVAGLMNASDVMEALIKEGRLDWANWLIARLLSPKDRIRYAVFAAEQVLGIFEKQYPDDKRPRMVIEAAKAVLKKSNKKTRAAAGSAAWAARAARAASAAGDASAAWDAARSAVWAAGDAARSAAWAAGDAMKVKIIRYGMGLCFGKEGK